MNDFSLEILKSSNDNNLSSNSSMLFNVQKNQPCEECEGWLIENFINLYSRNYHGIISIMICIFGTFSNALNVHILNQKDMITITINRILRTLAITDIIVMIEYVFFSWYFYLALPPHYPRWGAIFMMFHTHFSQIFHTVSICLTLTLAIWRYIVIGFPNKNRTWCSEKRCTNALISCYLVSLILCAPSFFLIKIKETKIVKDTTERTFHHLSLSDLASENETYLVFNFWAYAVLIKLLPCAILTSITIWLTKTLLKAKNQRVMLNDNHDPFLVKNLNEKTRRKTDRTTKMLVAVLILFLITEFPQAILGLMMGIKGKCFFLKCYQRLGELLDLLALINGSVSFILYCSMNKMFRTHFKRIFWTLLWFKLPVVNYNTTQEYQSTITAGTTAID